MNVAHARERCPRTACWKEVETHHWHIMATAAEGKIRCGVLKLLGETKEKWNSRIALSLSRVRLFVTLWIIARQAPPSMGFFRQGYRSRLPFPCPGDLPDPGIESESPVSPALQVDSSPTEPSGKPTAYLRVHAQSCLTFCEPIHCSWPGSSIHGVFQARMLNQIAIAFSRESS